MKKLITLIKNNTESEVHDDAIHRHIYSVDASIYEVEPLAIAIPKTKSDLLFILKAAAENGVAVIARGAATGITGGCLGKALIVDLSKYLTRILEINLGDKYAICEPGVVQDRLNEALAPYGYRLGPDTSTGNRATIGGMVGNNSAGARSLKFGRMVDHVKEVEIALAGGELIRFGSITEEKWKEKMRLQNREGVIYSVLNEMRSLKGEIEKRFPKIPRRVSGYNLDRLVGEFPLNPSGLIVGSEGSLGIVTEVKVDITPLPKTSGLCIIHFNDMVEGLKHIPELLQHRPISLEMIDEKILEMARQSPAVKSKLGWLKGHPKIVIVAELEEMAEFNHMGYGVTVLTDPKEMQHVWDVRKAGLGLLLSKRTYNRAIAFIEDISVAPEKLSSFMPRFLEYLKSKGKEAGIYGHVGSGCLHIRPYVDLRNEEEAVAMKQILDDVASMLLEFGGSVSGEHGDGLVRSWLNEKMFGPTIYKAFKHVKHAFDPKNLMNPGKIVDGPEFLENLRTQGEPVSIPTFLDFSKEGGFELSADLCNGNGMCRKKEGLMCPSYQATEDEYDTTRARAQTLRDIITGRMPKSALTSPDVLDVMDLCLECKGCKKECPSQVDMAKMKAELLYQYQEKHGYSLRSRLFSHMGTLFQLGSPMASFVNWMSGSFLGKHVLSWVGVSSKRTLPSLAKERFSVWFEKQEQPSLDKKVALFNDTYTEFSEPNIGKAAVKVLNALGYQVELIPWKCCGRPMISKGLLKEAKAKAETVASTLKPFLDKNIPVIALEPSCYSALVDDYSGLIKESLKVTLFDVFIAQHELLKLNKSDAHILIHGHCHQKALLGTDPTLAVLRSIPGATVTEINSGCCGMAGSFGYETEHYTISMKIGGLKLFPTIKNSSTESILVANGTSCRHQIKEGTNRKARHLAEILADLLSAENR